MPPMKLSERKQSRGAGCANRQPGKGRQCRRQRGAVQRRGRKRRPPSGKRPGGWTPKWIEIFRALLHCYLPDAFFTFKYRFPPAGGPTLRSALAALNKAIRNAAYRNGYRGAWCVFIEYGQEAGYHFHLWCAAVPPQDLMDALLRHWLRECKVCDNSEKVFHYSGKARSRQSVARYLGKVRSGACVCKHTFKAWKEDRRWKPFRFHRGDSTARPEAAAGNDVSQGTKCFFSQSNSAPLKRAKTLSVADSNLPDTSGKSGAVHLMREKRATQTCRGMAMHTTPAASVGRLGLRIAPRYGPRDALIYPDSAEVAEIAALVERFASHWTVERAVDAGPTWPPDTLESCSEIWHKGAIKVQMSSMRTRGEIAFRFNAAPKCRQPKRQQIPSPTGGGPASRSFLILFFPALPSPPVRQKAGWPSLHPCRRPRPQR